MKTIPELVAVSKNAAATRLGSARQAATITVEIEHQEQKTLQATYNNSEKDFQITIDEPGNRGGLGRGPGPLGLFLAGVGGSLLMQYANLAMAQELPIDTLKLTAGGHFSLQPPRTFQDLLFQVHLEGALSEAQLETLARQASRDCLLENTLGKAMTVTTEVHLNGRKALTLTRGPQTG